MRACTAAGLALAIAAACVVVAGAAPPQQPTFRSGVSLVTTTAIPRQRANGQFVADLKAADFEVYEDGVRQQVASLVMIQGAREFNLLAPQAVTAPAREGVIAPPPRPRRDTTGRIFLIVIDDLHLDVGLTGKLRQFLKDLSKTVIHDGDQFGVVSTGTSSIEQQLTYDRQILESIAANVKGEALKPSEIIQSSSGVGPASELRHRAHVAFQTAYELVTNLEKVPNRRKAVIYVSSGYDFNPFEQSRQDHTAEVLRTTTEQLAQDPFLAQERASDALNAGDLYREEAELIRAANRANATFYPMDPRGLVAGQDIAEEVNARDFQQHLMTTQETLRALAAGTGGNAFVNQNSWTKWLKRLDAETSDYYVLGFYSSNPDRQKRVRTLEVRVTRPGIEVNARTAYSVK